MTAALLISVTFLLQSELPLGLDVLQGRSQVPGQAAGAVGGQQGALLGQKACQNQDRLGGTVVKKKPIREAAYLRAHVAS